MRKTFTALAVAATMAFTAVAAPDHAEARSRGGRVAAGIIGGLAAGAIIGAIVAQPRYTYGPGYDYGPGYYGPYDYGPPPYAYEPRPVYRGPSYNRGGGCWIETDPRGFGYYGPCY